MSHKVGVVDKLPALCTVASQLAMTTPHLPTHALGKALTNLTQQDVRQVQWQTELRGEDWLA